MLVPSSPNGQKKLQYHLQEFAWLQYHQNNFRNARLSQWKGQKSQIVLMALKPNKVLQAKFSHFLVIWVYTNPNLPRNWNFELNWAKEGGVPSFESAKYWNWAWMSWLQTTNSVAQTESKPKFLDWFGWNKVQMARKKF